MIKNFTRLKRFIPMRMQKLLPSIGCSKNLWFIQIILRSTNDNSNLRVTMLEPSTGSKRMNWSKCRMLRLSQISAKNFQIKRWLTSKKTHNYMIIILINSINMSRWTSCRLKCKVHQVWKNIFKKRMKLLIVILYHRKS